MARNPVTVTLPPFHGMTRRLVLTLLAMYFGLMVLRLVSASTADLIENFMSLHPDIAIGPGVWQYFSYPFINHGLLSMLVGCLTVWFFGAVLEEERGGKWLLEYFLVSTAGGALLLCVASRTVFRHDAHGLEPSASTWGIWPAILALVLAYAYFHPEQELSFNFLFRVKAKYLAAIYLLVYFALAFSNEARMHVVAALCAGLAGYLFLRMAPRRGVRHAFSERWFGLRNAFYRRKRQKAARKFTVYMKQQGRDVNIDSEGKYIPFDKDRRDPNDRRWMN